MSRKIKESRTLNCNLNKTLYDRLAKDASDNDRTVTAELERILRIYFENKDKGNTGKV